jgi:flagellar biosynthesis/type III secretory pathway protein FliH
MNRPQRRFSYQFTAPAPVAAASLRSMVSLPDEHERLERARMEESLRAEGARSERARLEPVERALASAVETISGKARAIESEARAQMIELAKAIAREVIGREIHEQNHNLEAIVTECLQAARGTERSASIRLNPKDYEYAYANGVLDKMLGSSIDLQSDPSVERGSCRVETPYGEVTRHIADVIEDVFAAVDGRR